MRSMRCLVERESKIWCPLLGKYLMHRGVTICLPFKSFSGVYCLGSTTPGPLYNYNKDLISRLLSIAVIYHSSKFDYSSY